MISETNQCYFMLLLAVSLCLFIYVLSVHNSIPILYCSVYLHHRPNYAINILFCVIMYILAIPSIVLLPFSVYSSRLRSPQIISTIISHPLYVDKLSPLESGKPWLSLFTILKVQILYLNSSTLLKYEKCTLKKIP